MKKRELSFNQVVKGEKKFSLLITFAMSYTAILISCMFIYNLVAFKNAVPLEKLNSLFKFMGAYEKGSGIFLTINLLIISQVIVMLLIVPITAKWLDGMRIKDAIKNGILELSNKYFWKYLLKIYLPFTIILGLGDVLFKKILSSLDASFYLKLFESNLYLILFAIAIIVISILIATISNILFVGNICYLRGDKQTRILKVLKSIPNREINKLLIFNVISLVVGMLASLIIVIPLYTFDAMTFIKNIIDLLIALFAVIAITKTISVYVFSCLVINITSKVGKNQYSIK